MTDLRALFFVAGSSVMFAFHKVDDQLGEVYYMAEMDEMFLTDAWVLVSLSKTSAD